MKSLSKRLYRIIFVYLGIFYFVIILTFFILKCENELDNIKNELQHDNNNALKFLNEHIKYIDDFNFNIHGFQENDYFKNLIIVKNNNPIYIYNDSINLNLNNFVNHDLFISCDIIDDELVMVNEVNETTKYIFVFSDVSKRIFQNLNTMVNLKSKEKNLYLTFSIIFKQKKFYIEKEVILSTQSIYLLTEINHEGIYKAVINKYFSIFILLLLIFIIFTTLSHLMLDKLVKQPINNFISDIEKLEDNEFNYLLEFDKIQLKYTEFTNILKVFKNVCFYNVNKYKNLIQTLKKDLEIAKETNKSKMLFLANMSHEMRTPLNSIIGYTQLTKKIGFDEKQKVKEYFYNIQNSSEILLQKVNDILDYAKIEQNQFELNEKPTQFKQIIKDVHDLLFIQAKRKKINFSYSIDHNIPEYLDIDSTRLKQVLINFCSNAIKFTDKGSVDLKVKVFGYTNDAIYLEYTISDTGIGIPQDQIDSIFVPFVQVNNQGKVYGGTGLGLAIARDLIRLMDGDVNVISKENVGTIFTFITKFRISKKVEEKIKEEENINSEKFSEIINNKQILVCEDNVINQIFMKELFNVYNKNDIDYATDGIEAIEMCKDKVYDLILMDIQMPKLNGIEATKIIKNMINYKHVPIIALTANAFSDQIKEYLLMGMVDYLAKPIDIKHFKKLLIKYLCR